jgi:hypothetical protein
MLSTLFFQVNEFVNCLIDARNELLQRYVALYMKLTFRHPQLQMFCKPPVMSYSYDITRYENVQRSFKIKKAMLSNHRNYRSSYERLFEQVSHLIRG